LSIDDFSHTIDDFIAHGSILLVVTPHRWQSEIIDTARQLSLSLGVPCLSLATERLLFTHGHLSLRFALSNLSLIIDHLSLHPRFVIVAHNLATRGLSFVSSDFSRSLSHQIILSTHSSPTTLLQQCRIFGVKPHKSYIPTLATPSPDSLLLPDLLSSPFLPPPLPLS